MKLIVANNEKLNFSKKMKNSFRNISIVLLYTLGFSAYALLFLFWTIDFKNINWAWISIPIIGFLLGLVHIFFIYKGSLICKTITMLTILVYVFLLPVIVAIIN